MPPAAGLPSLGKLLPSLGELPPSLGTLPRFNDLIEPLDADFAPWQNFSMSAQFLEDSFAKIKPWGRQWFCVHEGQLWIKDPKTCKCAPWRHAAVLRLSSMPETCFFCASFSFFFCASARLMSLRRALELALNLCSRLLQLGLFSGLWQLRDGWLPKAVPLDRYEQVSSVLSRQLLRPHQRRSISAGAAWLPRTRLAFPELPASPPDAPQPTAGISGGPMQAPRAPASRARPSACRRYMQLYQPQFSMCTALSCRDTASIQKSHSGRAVGASGRSLCLARAALRGPPRGRTPTLPRPGGVSSLCG